MVNNFRLTLGMTLTFYNSTAKWLKIKVRMFKRTVVERNVLVTEEKLGV